LKLGEPGRDSNATASVAPIFSYLFWRSCDRHYSRARRLSSIHHETRGRQSLS